MPTKEKNSMSTRDKSSPLHERLIEAGIDELNMHGLQNFSVRRIAGQLDISVATPYKHFSDRDEYIAKIIERIVNTWEAEIPKIVAEYPQDYRNQIIELSLGYIKFLVKNSYYRSMIMIQDEEFDRKYAGLRHRLSNLSREIVYKYAKEVGMSREVLEFKVYVVRSLIYGAALMFDNGEIPYTEENLELVRRALDREFDLP